MDLAGRDQANASAQTMPFIKVTKTPYVTTSQARRRHIYHVCSRCGDITNPHGIKARELVL